MKAWVTFVRGITPHALCLTCVGHVQRHAPRAFTREATTGRNSYESWLGAADNPAPLLAALGWTDSFYARPLGERLESFTIKK